MGGFAEKKAGKVIFYAVDINGKFVGELPALIGQTLIQQQAEFESILERANNSCNHIKF